MNPVRTLKYTEFIHETVYLYNIHGIIMQHYFGVLTG